MLAFSITKVNILDNLVVFSIKVIKTAIMLQFLDKTLMKISKSNKILNIFSQIRISQVIKVLIIHLLFALFLQTNIA